MFLAFMISIRGKSVLKTTKRIWQYLQQSSPIGKFVNHLKHLLQLQLFISLISLPILISWGLPFSLLTFLGNIIFSYFLTAFLLISTLAFFLELLSIPNGICILILEKISSLWLSFLSLVSDQSWFIGFSSPHPLILVAILILTLLIVHTKIIASRLTMSLLIASLIISGLLTFIIPPKNSRSLLRFKNKQITLNREKNEITCLDEGIFGSHSNYSSWIEYTLTPELRKLSGNTIIDHYICLDCNEKTFYNLRLLCSTITIKNLYIPENGQKKKSFAYLKDRTTENNTKLIFIPEHTTN